jgi:hypothetical protein
VRYTSIPSEAEFKDKVFLQALYAYKNPELLTPHPRRDEPELTGGNKRNP